MVYCGKPSKACARCRVRRLKCDFGRPHCRKCLIAHVVCPGYRNEQDLLFRNQTDEIVNKHFSQKAASFIDIRSRTTTLAIKNLALVKEPVIAHGEIYLDESTLDVAVAFLLRCYFRGSSFEWVSQLYSDASCSPIFTDTVRATALAAYSHESHRIRLLTQARIMYDHALFRMRRSIEQGEPANNSMWASILLMSRFETLLNDGNEKSITVNWLNHVSGAFAIMQTIIKGGIPSSSLSQALMEQTLHNYNLYCLRTRIPRPKSLIIATNRLCCIQRCALQKLRFTFHEISQAFGEFRKFEQTNVTANPIKLMNWARDIEEMATRFQTQLSAFSSYRTLPISNLATGVGCLDFRPYLDVYHVYSSHHEARMWNGLRMLRLTLHESIQLHAIRLHTALQWLESAPWGESYEELQHTIAVSTAVIEQIVADICGSAPQFLHAKAADGTHAAACFLAWPLFVAGRIANGKYKEFVRNSLRWIAFELNIKSAQIAAEHLHIDDYKDGYLHACYMF